MENMVMTWTLKNNVCSLLDFWESHGAKPPACESRDLSWVPGHSKVTVGRLYHPPCLSVLAACSHATICPSFPRVAVRITFALDLTNWYNKRDTDQYYQAPTYMEHKLWWIGVGRQAPTHMSLCMWKNFLKLWRSSQWDLLMAPGWISWPHVHLWELRHPLWSSAIEREFAHSGLHTPFGPQDSFQHLRFTLQGLPHVVKLPEEVVQSP